MHILNEEAQIFESVTLCFCVMKNAIVKGKNIDFMCLKCIINYYQFFILFLRKYLTSFCFK